MIITIDGPVASGKSSVASALAAQLGFYYLYTGLLYRGIAYVLVKKFGYDREQLKIPREADLQGLMEQFEYRYEKGAPQIYYAGANITVFLKSAEIDDFSSLSSADPGVRRAILERQVLMGQRYDLIADGRDMGTVVYPNASCKFFLTASVEVRAQRWQKDQAALGNVLSLEEAIREISERDQRDITRSHSPLRPADDAVIVDNSSYSFEETVALMGELVQRNCFGHKGGCCCCS